MSLASRRWGPTSILKERNESVKPNKIKTKKFALQTLSLTTSEINVTFEQKVKEQEYELV